MDSKYIVFKRADLDELVDEIRESDPKDVGIALDSWRVDDAVVIRRQDMFSPPALDGYANTITAAVESIKAAYDGDGLPPDVYGVVRRLQGTADYFHSQALAAWDTDRKIPD